MFLKNNKKEVPADTESAVCGNTQSEDDEKSLDMETSPPPACTESDHDGPGEAEQAGEHCPRVPQNRRPFTSQTRAAKSELRKAERLEPWREMVMVGPEIIVPTDGTIVARHPSPYRESPIKMPSLFETKKKGSEIPPPKDGSCFPVPLSPGPVPFQEWEAKCEQRQFRHLEPWRKMEMIDPEITIPTDGSIIRRPPSPTYRYTRPRESHLCEKVVEKVYSRRMIYYPRETPEPGLCERPPMHPELKSEPLDIDGKTADYLIEHCDW